MAAIVWLLVMAVLGVVRVEARPMGGKFNDIIYSTNSSKVNGTCHMIGMFNSSTITARVDFDKIPKKLDVRLVVKLLKVDCANILQLQKEVLPATLPCEQNPAIEQWTETNLVAIATMNLTLKGKKTFKFHANMTRYIETPVDTGTGGAGDTGTGGDAGDTGTGGDTGGTGTGGNADDTETGENTGGAGTEGNTGGAGTEENTGGAGTEESNGGTVTEENADGKGSGAGSGAGEEKVPVATETRRQGRRSANVPHVDPVKNPVDKPEVMMLVGTNHSNGNGAGVYLIQFYIERLADPHVSTVVTATVQMEVHNPHGFLSAIDYPALVFYGLMTSVYAIYGIAWIVMMLCSFNDLVRLQFWVLAVIILGFLEKTFFVAEYSAINLGNDTYGSYFVAEFVSAIKRGISRMLLIIVAMGFGTVKPRLGDSLFKVVAAGVAYFALALVDGIMRARTDTFHTSDTSSVVTLALLLLLDTFIFYWIFTAIVDTRRTLRLRKNYVKLAMYNHFAYTLIFAITATIGFIIWVFVALEYPSRMCLTDWREVWLRDCFWHVLFAFILLVVMVIWRPSSNRSRFAYSLVTDADDDEVLFEQGSNKNFDTLKMRSVNKPGTQPPPVTSQAEDDLRWVEENLPTTAMDKALPLLLDSDEEVMTTKFEVSKMN